jgi:signal transduction histidine kinase
MRENAAAISVSDPSRRLPVMATGDEIARLGTTLNSMLDRLQAALKGERRFVDDASHELRTPLAILKTELDIALSRSRTPHELESALRSASEEADRLTALAEDLLVYSRSDGGRVPLHRTDTRLNSLLRNASSSFARRATESGVALRVDASAQAAHLDAARVRQAVENVIENALAHTRSGGDIHVRASRDREWVRLIVEDSGPGFPPDFVDHAFEPFARSGSERAGGRKGAGLGLAIVRAVAEAHGGFATAENRLEGGARVTVVLRDSDEETLTSNSPSSQSFPAIVGKEGR